MEQVEKEYSEMNRKERIAFLLLRIKMDKETVVTLKRQEKGRWMEWRNGRVKKK